MRFKHLHFCKSNPRKLPPRLLWLCSQVMNISWWASDTMPRKIFLRFFSFFSLRCPEVQVCHRGVKSPCGPQATDRIYNATIRWINFFPSWLTAVGDSPLVQLFDHCAVCWHSLNALSGVFCKGERSNFNQFRGQPVSFQTVTSFPVWLLLSSNDLAVWGSPWTSSVLNCWSRFCFVF